MTAGAFGTVLVVLAVLVIVLVSITGRKVLTTRVERQRARHAACTGKRCQQNALVVVGVR